MYRNVRAIGLFAATVLVIALAAGCGSAGSDKSKTQPKLGNIQGTIVTPPSSADVIDIQEHSGDVRSLILDGPLKNEAEVRSMTESGEPVVAFFRAEDEGDVLVRIEKAPAVANDVPRATGLITSVNKKGEIVLKTSDGNFEFIVLAEELEFFDYEHILEHKTDKAPITIYYEEPETAGTRTGLVYIGFDDA
jgi:hypothetical protein